MYIAYGFTNHHDALFLAWFSFFLFLSTDPLSSNDTNDPEFQLRLSFVSFDVSTCFFILIGYRI